MISLHGRPMIDHIVRYLAKFRNVEELVIICEFNDYGKQIMNYFEGKGGIIGRQIVFVEDKKNGTGGAIWNAKSQIGRDDSFLVWFADNLCALDVARFIEEFKLLNENQIKNIVGMIATRDHRREETGSIVCDPNETNRIIEFTEKPFRKLDLPETLGIYIFNSYLFDCINKLKADSMLSNTFDLSYDIL